MESGAPRSLRERALAVASRFSTPRSPLDFLFSPALASGDVRARVVAVTREDADTTTLTLSPAPRAFAAGQHVDLRVEIDGIFHTRTFSIAGSGASSFLVTVRASKDGRVTPHLVHRTKPGDWLRVSEPSGDFVLPENAPKLLFVTAGSGVTPVMSMLRDARDRGTLGDIVHLHFERTAARVLFDAELTSLAAKHPGFRRVCVLTQEQRGAHLTLTRLASACPDFATRTTFACGPAAMLDAISALYTELKIADQLRIERFHALSSPASPSLSPPASPSGRAVAGSARRVRFSRSDVTVDADGSTSLLVLAERAGLSPAHGCRRGICHACEAPLAAGSVRDVRTGAVTEASGASRGSGGCIQLCVSFPETHVELDL